MSPRPETLFFQPERKAMNEVAPAPQPQVANQLEDLKASVSELESLFSSLDQRLRPVSRAEEPANPVTGNAAAPQLVLVAAELRDLNARVVDLATRTRGMLSRMEI